MNIKAIVEQLKSNPKVIFLLDGIGALVTCLSLFGIGFWLQGYFGMPKRVLYSLAFVVVFYAVYSFSCYFFLFDKFGKTTKKWQSFLKIIITANSLYCVIMPFLLVQFYQNLTILGLFYFIFEVIVMTVLVVLEIKIASK
ncbi:hypothetical protein Fleli_1646 [Bernardetia litoralis DSM 6794]|uniref:Uncharacterized protein n=1 Tax=Bernardetia litoralis (strain ATCC 23117 / DSM 6794 / NBRC 15988 / NCIMB 1366 / Fx l1 / Sio-4) TaxID=880071 RepID=I4AJC3_BERLS|nr:hypothetical protein [Bernardetia litoralis]AFM04058.1 hypothetical protein Fleli_1646 [Bernardetia litoralis DSM 6794]